MISSQHTEKGERYTCIFMHRLKKNPNHNYYPAVQIILNYHASSNNVLKTETCSFIYENDQKFHFYIAVLKARKAFRFSRYKKLKAV